MQFQKLAKAQTETSAVEILVFKRNINEFTVAPLQLHRQTAFRILQHHLGPFGYMIWIMIHNDQNMTLAWNERANIYHLGALISNMANG